MVFVMTPKNTALEFVW